jgi:hypothetical protein
VQRPDAIARLAATGMTKAQVLALAKALGTT